MHPISETYTVGDVTAVIELVTHRHETGTVEGFTVDIYLPGDEPGSAFPAFVGYAADLDDAHRTMQTLTAIAQDKHERQISADMDEIARREVAALTA